jgi:hypothetical protein
MRGTEGFGVEMGEMGAAERWGRPMNTVIICGHLRVTLQVQSHPPTVWPHPSLTLTVRALARLPPRSESLVPTHTGAPCVQHTKQGHWDAYERQRLTDQTSRQTSGLW